MPVEDRAADTWESLIAVADLAGAEPQTRPTGLQDPHGDRGRSRRRSQHRCTAAGRPPHHLPQRREAAHHHHPRAPPPATGQPMDRPHLALPVQNAARLRHPTQKRPRNRHRPISARLRPGRPHRCVHPLPTPRSGGCGGYRNPSTTEHTRSDLRCGGCGGCGGTTATTGTSRATQHATVPCRTTPTTGPLSTSQRAGPIQRHRPIRDLAPTARTAGRERRATPTDLPHSL